MSDALRAPKDAAGVTIPSTDPDKKMGAIQTLFEIAWERTGQEMPLCGSCSESVLAEGDKKLKAIEAYVLSGRTSPRALVIF
jgi:hypothetical protein